MTLQHPEHLEYEKAEEYFIDKEYSLNNLGEGVYGWMKKIEKDKGDGFIHVPQSSRKRFFLTCFVKLEESKHEEKKQGKNDDFEFILDMNCPFKLFVNGDLIKNEPEVKSMMCVSVQGLTLKKGINRVVITAIAGNEDICFRPIFKNLKGKYADNLRYQLTINEVDPK